MNDLLPCIATSVMLVFVHSVLVVSNLTPEVVCSGFVASFDMSFGGSNSIELGWAMRDPAWFEKSSP